MYDVKHRFHVLSIVPSQENKLKQKGLYENLLCEKCETLFSKWERYASLIINGGIPLEGKRVGNFWHVSGIDYNQFKLFQLSILWRASISSLQFFENIDLGPHEENIRLKLLAQDAGTASTYGCIMFGLKFNDAAVTDLMIQPGRLKLHGHAAYRFVFGGFMWVYLVSSHAAPLLIRSAFLQPSGSVIFLVKDVATADNLVQFGEELLRLERL